MKTIADIIEALGGTTLLARRLVPPIPITTVSAWKTRENIPIAYWARIVEASEGKITPEALLQAHVHADSLSSATTSIDALSSQGAVKIGA
jgi:hypothetical protein